MNLSKTFLLTLLLLPATSWAMEPLTEESPSWLEWLLPFTAKKAAPAIYQKLLASAIKKLEISPASVSPTVLCDANASKHTAVAYCIPFLKFRSKIYLNPNCVSKNTPFGVKRGVMFHETAHALDRLRCLMPEYIACASALLTPLITNETVTTFFEKLSFGACLYFKSTSWSKILETFAETQAVKHLGCFECAKEYAAARTFKGACALEKKDPETLKKEVAALLKKQGCKDDEIVKALCDETFEKNVKVNLEKSGYLNHNQIISLAKETYGTDALCPYHKKLLKHPISTPASFFRATHALETQARPACFSCLPKELVKLTPKKRAKLLAEFIETKREEYQQKLEQEIVDGKLKI